MYKSTYKTEAERLAARKASYRKYARSPKGKKKYRRYYAKHKAACDRQSTAWRKEHRERYAELSRRKYRKMLMSPERYARAMERQARYRERHRERQRIKSRERYWKNRDARKAYIKKRALLVRAICCADAEYYAIVRMQWRVAAAKKAIRKRGKYAPKPHLRIPDWCVARRVLDARSPWLIENATSSQRAYAKELYRERKEKTK